MTRLTHALAALYALTALALTYTAITSWRHGAWPATLLHAGTAVLLVTAIAHHAYHRDELRAALARLERAARPPLPRRHLTPDEITASLAAACCEPWWTSCGTDHDPAHCTRKDQHQ